MERGRKNGLRWAVGMTTLVTGGILGAVLIPSFQPLTEARIHSPLPKSWTYVPRGSFENKPWVDIPWVGGARLKYPKPVAMPKTFKDHRDYAGIVLFNPSASGSGPMGLGSASDLYFPLATWKTSDGREAWLSRSERNAFNPDFGFLPFVFGTQSRRFRCEWPSFPVTTKAPNVMDVELPGNGQEAPPLEPFEVKMGNWTVRFRPRSWLGPSFTIDYEITVDGLPASDLAILHVNANLPGNLNDFLIDPNRLTVLPLSPDAIRSLSLRLTTTRRRPFTAKVVKGAPSNFEVMRNGKPLAYVYDSFGLQAFISRGGPEQPRTMTQIDGSWMDSPPLQDLDLNRLIARLILKKTYKHGQTLDGVEYLPVESKRADVKAKWPNFQAYPSAAAFLAKQRMKGP